LFQLVCKLNNVDDDDNDNEESLAVHRPQCSSVHSPNFTVYRMQNNWLRATLCRARYRPSFCMSVCPSVRPSICPSHGWMSQQESCAIAKTTARCALYIAALKNLHSPW